MADEPIEPPDLSDVPADDLPGLLIATGASDDPSDKVFANACRDELARRKPQDTQYRTLAGKSKGE